MTNTSTTALFTSLLNGVRRHNSTIGCLLYEDEVLAALAAAVPADLAEASKLIEDCRLAEKVMADTDTFPTGQGIMHDCGVIITALLARIASQEAVNKGLEAERDTLRAERDDAYAKGFSDAENEISATAIGQQNVFLHNQLTRAKAEVKKLRGGIALSKGKLRLRRCCRCRPHHGGIKPMTNEQIAIRQWLSKPAPYYDACACRGPQDNYPRCPCRMQRVEKVDGLWYEITEHRSPDGITHTAEKIG